MRGSKETIFYSFIEQLQNLASKGWKDNSGLQLRIVNKFGRKLGLLLFQMPELSIVENGGRKGTSSKGNIEQPVNSEKKKHLGYHL